MLLAPPPLPHADIANPTNNNKTKKTTLLLIYLSLEDASEQLVRLIFIGNTKTETKVNYLEAKNLWVASS